MDMDKEHAEKILRDMGLNPELSGDFMAFAKELEAKQEAATVKANTIKRLMDYGETWGYLFGGKFAGDMTLGEQSIDYGAWSAWHENQIYAVYVENLEEVTVERAIYRLYGYRLAAREKYKNDQKMLDAGLDGWFYPVLFGHFEPREYDVRQIENLGLEYWRITANYQASVDSIIEAQAAKP